MINEDFDKFIKYQEKEKTTYPGNGKRAKNTDKKTNNRTGTNQHPGVTGRDGGTG